MQYLYSNLATDKTSAVPVYQQLSNQVIALIKGNQLHGGQRLPGSRQLAENLNLHRKTVIRAYDELISQGWLESRLGSGTYIAEHIPKVELQQLSRKNALSLPDPLSTAGYQLKEFSHLQPQFVPVHSALYLDDGFPDARLAPLKDLSRAYRTQLLLGNPYARLGYTDPKGSVLLRNELSLYLNETRGLNTTAGNILIVRGSTMGVYLASTALLGVGDCVALGESSWSGARLNFIQAGAKVITIAVDQYGLDLEALEQICSKQPLRMVYVTSHHHYPTTVSLRADRRLQLLQLSRKYGFIIFEDDYDFDFHYENKPILPLASADAAGMVLYSGSFTKIISPAFRVGYIVGPENVINQLSRLRRLVDRQGDTMLENAMAELLQQGIIQRHLRKSLRLYRQRRDLACQLLSAALPTQLTFKIPEGGMAIWAQFDPAIDLALLSQKALKKGLYFSSGLSHNPAGQTLNSTRLGFASSTPAELEQSIAIIKQLI